MVELLCADACPDAAPPVAGADPAILGDARVLAQLLKVERHFVPPCDYFAAVRDDAAAIQPYMRRVVTTWMLEVRSCFVFFFPSFTLTYNGR